MPTAGYHLKHLVDLRKVPPDSRLVTPQLKKTRVASRRNRGGLPLYVVSTHIVVRSANLGDDGLGVQGAEVGGEETIAGILVA